MAHLMCLYILCVCVCVCACAARVVHEHTGDTLKVMIDLVEDDQTCLKHSLFL